MAENTKDEVKESKSNLTSFVWAGVVLFVAFLGAIVGLALAGQDVTSLVLGLAALLGAIVVAIPGTLAYLQSKKIAEKQEVVEGKIGDIQVKVDGWTTARVASEGERATAVATVEERDRGEAKAAELKIVTDATLAEAQAAPSILPSEAPPIVPTLPISEPTLVVPTQPTEDKP